MFPFAPASLRDEVKQARVVALQKLAKDSRGPGENQSDKRKSSGRSCHSVLSFFLVLASVLMRPVAPIERIEERDVLPDDWMAEHPD